MLWRWLAGGTPWVRVKKLTLIASLRQSLPNISFAFAFDQLSDLAVGGGMGRSHGNEATYPRLADVIGVIGIVGLLILVWLMMFKPF